MASTETASYSGVAKFLHWTIAALIVFMLMLGCWMSYLPNGGDKFFYYQLHKSIGITILVLSLARLAWRLTHRAPALPATMPMWEQHAAHFGHFVLYCAMIAMPLSGWIMVSASEHHVPTFLFGLAQLPSFPGVADSAYREQIDGATDFVHYWLAWGFTFLILGHAAAAWRHHLFVKDGVLLGMAPKFMHGFLRRMRGEK